MGTRDKIFPPKTTMDYMEKSDGGARLEQMRGGSEKESME